MASEQDGEEEVSGSESTTLLTTLGLYSHVLYHGCTSGRLPSQPLRYLQNDHIIVKARASAEQVVSLPLAHEAVHVDFVHDSASSAFHVSFPSFHVVTSRGVSPMGSPFIDVHADRRRAVSAYDDLLWLVLRLGCLGDLFSGGAACPLHVAPMLTMVAERWGVALHSDSAHFDAASVWRWLCDMATLSMTAYLILLDDFDADPDRVSHVFVVAGALAWLRGALHAGPRSAPALMAGDWAVSDICNKWPRIIGRELADFSWPIDSLAEVKRLLACPNGSPDAIVGCEFTAGIRRAREQRCAWQHVTLSVDERRSLVPGPHAVVDLRLVLFLKEWEEAYMHPPCTHQVLSDTTSLGAKQLDGRSFWGIAFVILCWCVVARRVLLEQPKTIISQFYLQPTQIIRPCDAGDDDTKPMELRLRGRELVPVQQLPDAVASSGHKRLRDFRDADERDRWRSSWGRFPLLCDKVVEVRDILADIFADAEPERLCYADEIECFAGAWYDAGLPVPHDYLAPDAQPTSEEARQYQRVRGRGDGRRVHGVVPASRMAARPSAPLDASHGKHTPPVATPRRCP